MSKKIKNISDIIVYQAKNGAIEFRWDISHDTIWASLDQLALLFWKNKSTISRHIRNIFNTEELLSEWVVAKFATTASDGKTYQVDYYNLDMILSVGYRVNSKQATEFRKWSNSILKQYITQGYSINTELLQKNTESFNHALEYLQSLWWENFKKIDSWEILSLIQSYANTWLNLDAYDKQFFPKSGFTSTDLEIQSSELLVDIEKLKRSLIKKDEATDLFAQEKNLWNIEWIVGNIFQTFWWHDLYPTLEEKAAHLLYFMIKNHPFTDGNKRSGAFSFLWFLQKAEYKHISRISPETLTTLTLLIAESNPKEKEKMIGLVLLLLK